MLTCIFQGLRGEEMGSFCLKVLEFQFCKMKKTSGILPHHNMNRFNPNKLHTYIVKFSFLQEKKEKKFVILIPAITWMKLVNILCGKSQAQLSSDSIVEK